MAHQDVRERRADHRAAAEARDRHAGRHAAPLREPFDQRRDRGDVAQAQADAADRAGAEQHQPELVPVDAQGREDQAAAPAKRRDEGRLARAGALQPAAPDRGGRAKEDEEQCIDHAELADLPVAAGSEERAEKRHAAGQATVSLPFTARVSGSQNTLKPYAMPMQRWIESAAGGTSQRLNAGPAMMRSFESSPTPSVG